MSVELNEANFQSEVLESDLPVLVDFWSEHCGPCKSFAPVLDQLAEEVAAWAKVAKIDAIANQSLSIRYGVRSVPNLLFFKNGEVKEQFVGAGITKAQLREKLEALI
jgi:thioredoxin 1